MEAFCSIEHIWPQSTYMYCARSGIYYISFTQIFSSTTTPFVKNIFLSAGYIPAYVWHVGLQGHKGNRSRNQCDSLHSRTSLMVQWMKIHSLPWNTKYDNSCLISGFLWVISTKFLDFTLKVICRRMCVTRDQGWPRIRRVMCSVVHQGNY